jgi:transcription elongation factor GreA
VAAIRLGRKGDEVQEIRNKLEAELRLLEHEIIHELPKEIQTAREHGDLRENAEYKAAIERQNFVRARVDQVRQRLGEISRINVDALPHDKSHLGSRLTVLNLDTKEELTYELVIAEAADVTLGKISIAAPIGRGLMGKEPGDEVRIKTPAGVKKFEIVDLETIHERSKDGDS